MKDKIFQDDVVYMIDFGCHGNVNFERIIFFLFYALLGQIWIILNS